MGVILFKMLTGELPFRGTPRMLLHQVLNDEPPRRGVSTTVSPAIWKRSRSRRWPRSRPAGIKRRKNWPTI